MKKYLRLIIVLIAILTIISGLVQMLSPSFVLKLVGGDITASTDHLFAIIGMFMFLFGGLLLHSLYSVYNNRRVVLWCALQKLGASVAVFIAIEKHLFMPVAALVAGFDLLSAVLFFMYYKTIGSLQNTI
jgi:uncharacterized protein YjeT (DUF2065 family)